MSQLPAVLDPNVEVSVLEEADRELLLHAYDIMPQGSAGWPPPTPPENERMEAARGWLDFLRQRVCETLQSYSKTAQQATDLATLVAAVVPGDVAVQALLVNILGRMSLRLICHDYDVFGPPAK
jgi:hypothetical protein